MTKALAVTTSTPTLTAFNPAVIPMQIAVLTHLRRDFDMTKGVCEILLSGSVGSAKTLLCAHIAVTHALLYPGSQQLLLRESLKDLKATLWRVLLTHCPHFRSYWNKSEMTIHLPNGSIIYAGSYADGDFTRFRSYELSGVILEEGVESKAPELYDELLQRIGRLPHVPENYFIVATNPDDPSHYLHQKFIDDPTENRKVFYSLTEQNPFLPEWYVKQLRASLPFKMAQRMLEGKWVSIATDVVYYEYDRARNYRETIYKINPNRPLHITWDFNVALGKPMSVAIGQLVLGEWHWFAESVIEGARTLSILEDLDARDVFETDVEFIINGDATGEAGSANSLLSNYDIIRDYLTRYRRRKDGSELRFRVDVPLANPPIKTRHNVVNSYCFNALKQTRAFFYSSAPILEKGMRLVALKKGGDYVEDDSKDYQHVTTAVGYAMWKEESRPKSRGSQSRN